MKLWFLGFEKNTSNIIPIVKKIIAINNNLLLEVLSCNFELKAT